jgi:hypothetical protein
METPASDFCEGKVLTSSVRRRKAYPLLICIAVAIAIRLYLFCLHYPLEYDEAMLAVNIRETPLLHLFHALPYYDIACPAGYLLGSKLVGIVAGYSDWAMRLFPLLLCVVSLLIFASASAFSRFERVFTLCMLSVNPLCLQYSAEAKHYSAELALGLVFCVAAKSVTVLPARRNQVAFAVIAALCAVFVTGFPFLMTGVLVAMVTSVDRTRIRQILSLAAAGYVVWAAYFLFFFRPTFRFNRAERINYEVMPAFHPLHHFLGWWYSVTVGLLLQTSLGLWAVNKVAPFLPLYCLVALPVVFAFFYRRSLPFFARIFLVTYGLCLAAGVVGLLPMNQVRWFMFLAPGMFLMISEAWQQIFRGREWPMVAFIVPLVLAITITRPWLKQPRIEDTRQTLAYLRSHPDHLHLIVTPSAQPFMDFYFRPFGSFCITPELLRQGYVNRCSANMLPFAAVAADVAHYAAVPGVYAVQSWVIESGRGHTTSLWRQYDRSGVQAAMDRYLQQTAIAQNGTVLLLIVHGNANYVREDVQALEPLFQMAETVHDSNGGIFNGLLLQLTPKTR